MQKKKRNACCWLVPRGINKRRATQFQQVAQHPPYIRASSTIIVVHTTTALIEALVEVPVLTAAVLSPSLANGVATGGAATGGAATGCAATGGAATVAAATGAATGAASKPRAVPTAELILVTFRVVHPAARSSAEFAVAQVPQLCAVVAPEQAACRAPAHPAILGAEDGTDVEFTGAAADGSVATNPAKNWYTFVIPRDSRPGLTVMFSPSASYSSAM